MNLGNLYFDIVSDLELRISDFASLGIFTLVKNPLQIDPFMQNEPNFQKSQVNVTSLITVNYENKSNWTLGKNKPNTNPIKANFKRAQMNVNSLIAKDYRKKDDFAVRKNKPNSNPISENAKMNANLFVTKDYENELCQKLQKNKPNQTQFQTQRLSEPPYEEFLTLSLTLSGFDAILSPA